MENLTKEDAEYIGGKNNEVVQREVDAYEEKFVLNVENENDVSMMLSNVGCRNVEFFRKNGYLT